MTTNVYQIHNHDVHLPIRLCRITFEMFALRHDSLLPQTSLQKTSLPSYKLNTFDPGLLNLPDLPTYPLRRCSARRLHALFVHAPSKHAKWLALASFLGSKPKESITQSPVLVLYISTSDVTMEIFQITMFFSSGLWEVSRSNGFPRSGIHVYTPHEYPRWNH